MLQGYTVKITWNERNKSWHDACQANGNGGGILIINDVAVHHLTMNITDNNITKQYPKALTTNTTRTARIYIYICIRRGRGRIITELINKSTDSHQKERQQQ